MRFAVLLHGCGVYDGTEIQEAVLTYLAISEAGHEYFSVAPNWNQHHVLNHLDGSEMPESRNVLVESARIARGAIRPLETLHSEEYDILALPGGFGTAKNLTDWAFHGPDSHIREEVKEAIVATLKARKPILALCMSPTTVAKALEGTGIHPKLSIGTPHQPSPYDISGIAGGIERLGGNHENHGLDSVSIDAQNRIVSAPCYMMTAGISEVWRNIRLGVKAVLSLVQKTEAFGD
ncbi:isoprenoid biosynthesis glyoxalase ElbB [bacterium]|nr:isoprenoid biosynthesis glyoxalase ElbB [bacterium]